MRQLSYCIQCNTRDGSAKGDFVFDKNAPFEPISPVFSSLPQLYDWMRENKLRSAPISVGGHFDLIEDNTNAN